MNYETQEFVKFSEYFLPKLDKAHVELKKRYNQATDQEKQHLFSRMETFDEMIKFISLSAYSTESLINQVKENAGFKYRFHKLHEDYEILKKRARQHGLDVDLIIHR